MPRDKQAEGEWQVFDMNANSPDPTDHSRVLPRVHESRLGIKWPLRSNEPCYMPEPEARVFLKDPGFKVLNFDGEEVPPLSLSQRARNLPAVLAPNLVIAALPELTTEALLTRVAQMRGGTRFNSTSPRDRVIDFIMEQETARQAEGRPDGALADAEVDEVEDEEAARILQAA